MPRDAITLRLPAILYLCILDRLGEAWHYGQLGYAPAFGFFSDTLAVAESLPGKAGVRASIRLTA
jgi:hypothetical protein